MNRVRVYRNLRSGGLSVQHYQPGKGWRVGDDRRTEIALRDVRFIVSAAGRQRVLAERRKNVHAFVEGTEIDRVWPLADPTAMRHAKYNPYEASHFRDIQSGEPVTAAAIAHVSCYGVLYS